MKRIEIFNMMAVALTLLAIVPNIEGQVGHIIPTNPRPLCPSQFALVNYACGRLPFTPGPLPEPPSPDDDGGDDDGGDDKGHNNHHHHHRHEPGHRHKHGHRHRRHQTPEEDNCCRWAREVDSQCVCELLVRLPPFLVRPLHVYTLAIGDDCEITYSCGGPI